MPNGDIKTEKGPHGTRVPCYSAEEAWHSTDAAFADIEQAVLSFDFSIIKPILHPGFEFNSEGNFVLHRHWISTFKQALWIVLFQI